MQPNASPFPSATQRTLEREAKRIAVLRAAVHLFNERGFHATSLDDVATTLGITKPTIYHYLGNKDQVLLECVTIGLRQLLQAADTARRVPGSGIDRLRSFLQRYAEITMDDFGRCIVRTGDELLSPDSVKRYRALRRDIDMSMRGLIEEGIADGSIPPLDAKLLAFTLAGALNWPARWYDPNGPHSPQDIAAHMVTLLASGFAPRQ